MADAPTTLGALRWLCVLARRASSPDQYTGVTETIIEIAQVHCDIQPVGSMVFLAGDQTETPFTHRIFMRWRDYGDASMFNVIMRDIVLPNGSSRNEIYRVHRVSEYSGRHRFLMCEVELERYTTVQP